MTHPRDMTPAQRGLLLELACLRPGQWAQYGGNPSTLSSLRRRGLVEADGNGAVRLAHNSAAAAGPAARCGGAPV